MIKKHLYNTKVSKIKWFIKRFGFKEIIKKPIRKLFSPFIISFLPNKIFFLNDKQYNLFYHNYNITWANERCIEIPVVLDFIKNNKGRILEVGNVLSHYFDANWDILDKFEKRKGIFNEDANQFCPNIRYDLIISISTFEHIGFDDESNNKKVMTTFNNLKKNCLNKKGKIIITAPIGYNPEFDKIISGNQLKFDEQMFLGRDGLLDWKQITKEEALKSKYNKPFPYGNCVFFGVYNSN